MLKKSLLTVAAAGLAISAFASAQAAVGVRAGVLTCNVASGAGFVFGSDKAVSCTFSGTGGRVEHYAGNIQKFGVDIGYTRRAVLANIAAFSSAEAPDASRFKALNSAA
jgi:hypothetical protein